MIKNKWPYILVIVLLIGGGFIYFHYQSTKNTVAWGGEDSVPSETAAPVEPAKDIAPSTEVEAPKQEDIFVDLKGAVKNPGVYQMKTGDRVVNVLEKAGGLTDKADKTKVNFAKKLSDEMMIYIPKLGEESPSGVEMAESTSSASTNGSDGKININTASEEELEKIPGIGPSKAAAIIEYRKKNGGFKTIQDLDKVSGIGEKSIERMKDQISVN